MSETGDVRVLHVDDDSDLADMVADFLEREDDRLVVETASSAGDGLDRLAETDVDCVVSDYQMPGRNGIEFLESVREEHTELPFILYTGKGSEEVASDAISAGATDYLQKGTGTDQYTVLANRIRNAVEQYRASRRAADLDRVRTLASTVKQTLVRTDSRPEAEARICEVISDAQPYLFAWVGEVNPETDEIEPRASAGVEEGYLDDITVTADDTPTGQGAGGVAVRERRVAVTQNIRTDVERDRWREHALERGYQAVAAVPLAHEDALYGVLLVYADRPGAFDDTERELLAELGDDVAHAFHSLEMQERLRAEHDRREALFENAPSPVVASRLEENDDLVMTDINDAFERTFGYDTDEVAGADPAELIVPEGEGDRHAEIRERATRGQSVVTAVERLTADGPREFLLHVIPYGTGGESVDGMYAWYTDVSGRRERERAIEDLHQTTDALMEATTGHEVAEITADAVRDILGMPANGVHLYDESEDGLVPVAWTEQTEEIVGEPPTFAPGEGLAGTAFETGEPQVYDDISTVPERFNPDTDVRSQTVFPLGDHGVIVIGSPEPGAFDDVEVSLADTLATHVTTALDRIEREQKLHEERAFIDQALDTLNDLFYVIGTDGELRRWNARFSAVTGYTDAELAEMQATDIFPENERARVADAVEETLTTGETVVEADLLTADGERIPYEFTGDRLTDTDGDLVGLIGIGRDVTGRKRRERRLERLVDTLPGMVYRCENEPGWPMENVGGEVEELTGYRPSELEGGDGIYGERVVHPDDREEVWTTVQDALNARESFELTYRIRTKDETVRWVWERGRGIYSDDGDVEALRGFITDITERKERERALARLHESTRRLLHAGDRQTVATRTANALRDILGYPNNVVRLVSEDGTHLEPVAVTEGAQTIFGEERPVYAVGEATPGRAYAEGETLLYEDVQTLDDEYDRGDARAGMYVPVGEHGVVSINDTTPGAFDESDVQLAETIAANATVALDLIQQTRQLQRQNERLDRFASVVSHDLRNPLNVVQGRLELAREECDSDHLDDAANAVDRSLALVDDLLTLAREGEQVTDVETVHLAETVENCWRTVETKDAGLVVETGQTIRADASRLQELLENLFRNAVRHGGGDVTVTIGGLENGFYVADDGPGVPENEREKVFEAGYSTADGGTGFGLNIVREIAESHGWNVGVTDSESDGARFEITGIDVADE